MCQLTSYCPSHKHILQTSKGWTGKDDQDDELCNKYVLCLGLTKGYITSLEKRANISFVRGPSLDNRLRVIERAVLWEWYMEYSI